MTNFFKRIKNKTNAKWESNKIPIICTLLIILFVFVYFYDSMFISIHSGEAGVKYKRFSGGTVVDRVYSEGFHVIPFWDRMYIYNVRVQETKHQMEVLSSEGLRFHINLSIRYHPEYEFLGYLHKRVGPQYVETIVVPEIESVLRAIVGRFTPEEVYTTKRGLLNKSLFSAFSEIRQKFIILDDVIIRDVILPDTIKNAIEQKLKADQLVQEYKYLIEIEEKEKDRKKIEAEGIRQYQDIVSQSLTNKLLEWQGIKSTLRLAESNNAKIVVIGRGKDGLPLILDMKQDDVKDSADKEVLDDKENNRQNKNDASSLGPIDKTIGGDDRLLNKDKNDALSHNLVGEAVDVADKLLKEEIAKNEKKLSGNK